MKKVQKFSALFVISAILFAQAPLASAYNIKEVKPLPILKKTRLRLDINWGNVYGPVQNSTKTNFDGSVSVNNKSGSVELVKTVNFEKHDAYRDKITSKANPVIWRSWIYNLSDGVIVDVNTFANDKVTIKTMQGELVLPMKTLINAKDKIELSLGDGREIVVGVEKLTPSTPAPFHIALVWGGPLYKTKTVESLIDSVKNDPILDKTFKKVLPEKNAKNILPYYTNVDFTGATATARGATMELKTPFWFEKDDSITSSANNYVSWKSKIHGHFDGVLLKASFDATGDIDDDTFSYKTEAGGVGFSKDLNLLELYKKGWQIDKFEINGKVYIMAAIVIKRPICSTFFSQYIDNCVQAIEPKPLPKPLPFPKLFKPSVIRPIRVDAVSAQAYKKPLKQVRKINIADTRAQLDNLYKILKEMQIKASSIK